MSAYVAELIGTMLLILFGGGVVANVVLTKTKGNGGGWIVITAGWGLGVAMAVYCTGMFSGAHINPAVTLALAITGKFSWSQVPGYIICQILGGLLGGVMVFLSYLPHFEKTDDPDLKLAIFSTAPAIRNYPLNLLCEIIGTFVLILGVLCISDTRNGITGGNGPLLVGFLVWSIGLSLGGPTGYAINPARDLGPRIAHFILPIPGKGTSDWAYSWVPVAGPLIGAVVGALFYKLLWMA